MSAVRTARAEGAETMCTTVRRHGVLPSSLCAVLPLLLLTGCGGTEPLAAESAVAHYDAVAADLVEALESQGLDVDLAPATRLVAERDGRCAYDAGTWIPARSVEDALRSEDGWGHGSPQRNRCSPSTGSRPSTPPSMPRACCGSARPTVMVQSSRST